MGRYAPALFPLLVLVGAIILALRSGHRRRIENITQDRAVRKAERQANLTTERNLPDLIMSNAMSNSVNVNNLLDKARQARKIIQANRLDNLLTLYRENPTIGVTDAARTLKLSRQTIYTYLGRLETDGRIRRNGHVVEVI